LEKRMACRHCEGTEFFHYQVNLSGELAKLLPLGFMHDGYYDCVICGTCGFTEWFVAKNSLSRLKEKFDRVV
jgi:predicted nucleic-acid-binding Zn-ribbon protein